MLGCWEAEDTFMKGPGEGHLVRQLNFRWHADVDSDRRLASFGGRPFRFRHGCPEWDKGVAPCCNGVRVTSVTAQPSHTFPQGWSRNRDGKDGGCSYSFWSLSFVVCCCFVLVSFTS